MNDQLVVDFGHCAIARISGKGKNLPLPLKRRPSKMRHKWLPTGQLGRRQMTSDVELFGEGGAGHGHHGPTTHPESPSCFWRGGTRKGGGRIGARSRRLIPQSELTSRSLHISGKGGRNLTGEDGWMDRGRMETLYYLNARARHAPFPALIWPAGSLVYTTSAMADFVSSDCSNLQLNS